MRKRSLRDRSRAERQDRVGSPPAVPSLSQPQNRGTSSNSKSPCWTPDAVGRASEHQLTSPDTALGASALPLAEVTSFPRGCSLSSRVNICTPSPCSSQGTPLPEDRAGRGLGPRGVIHREAGQNQGHTLATLESPRAAWPWESTFTSPSSSAKWQLRSPRGFCEMGSMQCLAQCQMRSGARPEPQ